MITLEGSTLRFRFPEVHDHARTEIHFQRTLRIPDDGKHYPLPPGLGTFPLAAPGGLRKPHPQGLERARRRDDAALSGGGDVDRLRARADSYPCAIKIAAGKINAVSGKPWKPELDAADHDYVVVPEQPWLDGFCVAKDVIRQFVAMPLGSGYSVEEQITGKAEHGGLQMLVYPMKKERYEPILRAREEERRRAGAGEPRVPRLLRGCAGAGRVHVASRSRRLLRGEGVAGAAPRAMALAAGGRMKQQIYKDPYGLDAWDQSVSSRCFVTLVDAVQWHEITGAAPPTKPPTAADYTSAGLPWFDYYAADLEALAGAAALTKVKSVAEMAAEKGEQVLGPDGEVDPPP